MSQIIDFTKFGQSYKHIQDQETESNSFNC